MKFNSLDNFIMEEQRTTLCGSIMVDGYKLHIKKLK